MTSWILNITDLLADVIVEPNGSVKVIDLDEFVTALDEGSLQLSELKNALLRLDNLLKIIYTQGISSLTTPLIPYDI